MRNIVLMDTSIASNNIGDHIIVSTQKQEFMICLKMIL
jgi:hypothetical protein